MVNLKNLLCGSVCLCSVCSLVVSAEVIDISAAVRAAEKATTVLDVTEGTTGKNLSGYTVGNAFGDSETKESRIMLTDNAYNRILWTIANDYETGKPIVVTKFTIKRTSPASGANSPYGENRAPTEFYFQASQNGRDWITLYEQVTPKDEKAAYWKTDVEKTFEIDPIAYGDYRRYRFVTGSSNAAQDDTVKCAFQYIKVYGTVGDYGTLATASHPLDYLITTAQGGVHVDDYTPTLDSKIEADIALRSVSGTQAIAVAGASGQSNQMRLFYMADGGWTYSYGSTMHKSGVKAYAGARYKIVVDGPKVTVNGKQVIDAGETLTGEAGSPLRVFGSPATPTDRNLYNMASVQFWSLKISDKDGNPALDLRPIVSGDGTARLQDTITKKTYRNAAFADGLPVEFKEHKWQNNFTANMRDKDFEPKVTLIEGSLANPEVYPVANAVSTGFTAADRVLFSTEHVVIQYDIPDDYNPGYPMVLARYAIIPCVGDGSESINYTIDRAPHHFELQASKDGVNDWVTLSKVNAGSGPGVYSRDGFRTVKVGDKNYYNYYGPSFNIPEEKRDDYRHYRLVTEKASAASYDTVKTGFQEIRFFGYDGGFEMAAEPLEYVQNAAQNMATNNTYFATGVTPQACDLTIEMTGSFTKVDQTSCLFCSRGANSANTWTLFLLDGLLRLDCKTAGQKSTFRPVANQVYTIKVAGNALYVDGKKIYESGTTDFVPGSEIYLLSSHNAGAGFHNQAQFKMQSCTISDSCGGVLRKYVAVKRSDGTIGLFEQVNDTQASHFVACGNKDPGGAPKGGEPLDGDFWQRDRGVTLTTELDGGKLPNAPLTFAFAGNQRLSAELYAAFDTKIAGNSTNGWAKVVKIGDVTSATGSLTVEKLPKTDGNYSRVKFFVCDKMARNESYTQTYKTGGEGLVLFVR